MVNKIDFEKAIEKIFKEETKKGKSEVLLISGEIHRLVGNYPDSKLHRNPVLCNLMKKIMKPGDIIISQPPKGQGAYLKILYKLPR